MWSEPESVLIGLLGNYYESTVTSLNLHRGLLLLLWIDEKLLCWAVLNDLTKIHVDALAISTLRLSHVVEDSNNSEALFQVGNEILNTLDPISVQGRTRLIHQNDLRLQW